MYRERSALKDKARQIDQKYNSEIHKINHELDKLRVQISEKRKITKAFKIREELINLHISPMRMELNELIESKDILKDNLRNIREVYSQCHEELQMSQEDQIGKMMSRVDLVAEIEEYEELIENLKAHYSSEEIEFIIKNLNMKDIESIPEYGKMRVY